MKRCPKCSRNYPTGNQRFCTNDGEMLVVVDAPPTDTSSKKFADPDAPTRVISQELVPDQTAKFDPFKTTVGAPVPASEQTSEMHGRVTGDLSPPAPLAQTQFPAPPSPPVSGPISQPLGEVTSPSMPYQQQSAPPQGPSSPQQTSGSLPLSGFGPVPASAAPPPRQTSGSLSPTGSGPIAAPPAFSATIPLPQFTGASQPQQVQRLTAPPPAMKPKLPLLLGLLAILFLLGAGVLGVAYFFVFKPMIEARRTGATPTASPQQNPVEVPPNAETTPVQQETTATPTENVPPPFTPPANAVQFVNSNDKLDGKLAEHYVDFSFYYPDNWQKDPKSGVAGASNFAKVERRLPPDFTQENFAVGWYSSSGSLETDQSLFHSLADSMSSQFAKNFPEYRKVSEGAAKVGVYDGYELRFEGLSRNTAKGDLKLWGRVVFLPPQDGGKNGVTLLMLATSLAPELESVADVGEKGELPMILESFRFGRSASQ